MIPPPRTVSPRHPLVLLTPKCPPSVMRGVPVATGSHPSPPRALQRNLATAAPIFRDPAICRRGRKQALCVPRGSGSQVGKECAQRSEILRAARSIVETLRRGISAPSEVARPPIQGPKPAREALRYLPPEPPTRGRPAVSVKGPKGPIIIIDRTKSFLSEWMPFQ